MFWKKTGKFWKPGLRETGSKKLSGLPQMSCLLLGALCLSGLWACRGAGEKRAEEECCLLYGNRGYVIAEESNQENPSGAEQAEEFCRKVQEGEHGGMTLAVLSQDAASEGKAFTKYECRTQGGKVNVRERYFAWMGQSLGKWEERSLVEYEADFWEYTEGYLFFGRSLMPGYDGPSYCRALRLEALEDQALFWNRAYILPTGYGGNNLFLENWDGEDYGEMNFYDLFDAWYPCVYGKPLPYTADENCNIETVYRIPAKEFEAVIQAYLVVDREVLRENAGYFPEDHTYEYRPRGLYGCWQTDIFPEVTDGRENEDGTLTLTVRAVDPGERKAAVFTHETVVRPLEGGGFQYVSNRVLSMEEPADPSWYRERRTQD